MVNVFSVNSTAWDGNSVVKIPSKNNMSENALSVNSAVTLSSENSVVTIQ